jgi:hypothetical protein
MVATLNNCQEVMKKYNVPEEEIDNVQSTLAVSQQHATEHDDEIDPSKWPSASNQQQPQTPSRPSKENNLQLQRSAPPPRQQTQQAPAQHQSQQHQERPTSFPPTFIVMDENVRAVPPPVPNGQQAGYRSSSPPPPAPMPLQRNTASPATAGMYGSNTSVSSGNALYASRDSNLMFDSYSSQNGYGGYGYVVGGATPQQQQQPRPGSQQSYREAEAVL